MVQVHQVTPEGLEKLKAELKKLKTVDRPETVKRMAEARELGDLSENADYHDAREQLAFIEGRIEELEIMIKRAEVVTSHGKAGIAQMGSTVVVKSPSGTATYQIVGANESDPGSGKISAESPVGSALMDAKKGDTVTVTTPGGSVQYAVLEIK